MDVDQILFLVFSHFSMLDIWLVRWRLELFSFWNLVLLFKFLFYLFQLNVDLAAS